MRVAKIWLLRTAWAVLMLHPVTVFSSSNVERLRTVVTGVIEEAPGEMGVAIKHLESGESIEVHADRRFPMASTFKLPVLVELFHQVEQGRIRLDEMVVLDPTDQHLGSGELSRFVVPGASLSVENLALLMMRISDNSAADILLARVGVESVNQRLAALGIEGISVDRSCQDLILDWTGFDREKARGLSHRQLAEILDAYEPEPQERERFQARFNEDLRDTATPRAMNLLLEKILRKEAASPESCEKMIGILLKCETGEKRIRGLLPSKTEVAHKTGTIGGTVNNVGIVFLPEGRGHVAISVLSRKMEDQERAEGTIADIARYAYDFFLFNAPVGLAEN